MTVVDSGGVALATRDYGGGGSPLVLMHGAGMEQGSLEPVASRLSSAFRVVTFDFRGHGGSERAPWTVAGAVQDLSSVIGAYGLVRPVVGGHSLGGMVAVAYAAGHPGCRAAINIDGHGRGRSDQYPGHSPAEVEQYWAQQDARLDRLTRGGRAVLIKALLMVLRKSTITGETAREVTKAAVGIDLDALYRQLACPLLVFNATSSHQSRLMRRWAADGAVFAAAYRTGLARDLGAIAAECPQVEVETVDGTHLLIRTHPELVAQRIAAFLQE